MIQELIALQPSIHQMNVEKGFWPEGRNKGEAVMLMITELAEAVEAHRAGRVFNIDGCERISFWLDDLGKDNITWAALFKEAVKDTVEDEIADTVIRLLDFCGGFKHSLEKREGYNLHVKTTGNFAHDILNLAHHICVQNYVAEVYGWHTVLENIVEVASWYNINLLQHVQWKLKYNATRGHKHGKTY